MTTDTIEKLRPFAANRRVSIMIPFKDPSPALLRAIIERRLPVETD